MDWLQGMNRVIAYIEDNLQQPIPYDSLSRIVGCSVYEFSRIFSFMAGISVSEYIRRRRLSQAVFDIQNTDDKIITISLRYGYESPNTFARAFKELHGTTPTDARHANVTLKTYPPISFILSIKGVNEMQFRIEKTEATTLYGTRMGINPSSGAATTTAHTSHEGIYHGDGVKRFDSKEAFHAHFPEAPARSWGEEENHFIAFPVLRGWQGDITRYVTAYDFALKDGILWYFAGGDPSANAPPSDDVPPPDDVPVINDLNYETLALPSAVWAVFSLEGITDLKSVSEGISQLYTRIQTEWFPVSGYQRDEAIPHLEVNQSGLNVGDTIRPVEIWMPVVPK